ncbi:hypothetical protein LUZ60_017137 [Juncus effusus]|nr:hypothetical protein LUZ60_017137 [Juncus effusus]
MENPNPPPPPPPSAAVAVAAATPPASAVAEKSAAESLEEYLAAYSRWYQHVLDRTTPYLRERWLAFFFLAVCYLIRVWILEGFYIVTYGLGIFCLSQLVGFLSPMVDPEMEELIGGPGPSLPTLATDEFRPFVRRLPEFKFWYALTKGFCIAFLMTFFGIFDIPVFWPILVVYFCALAFMTLKRQVQHMIKYKYLPFSFGKQRYNRKREAAAEEASSIE